MTMGRCNAILTFAFAFASLASCGAGEGASSSSTGPETASSTESLSTGSAGPSSSSDVFGDPSDWPGETVKTRDLGDALFAPYPDDSHYDWGQSILYDEEDGIYKMWWCRQSPHDTIWYAESTDLKHWDNLQKIMAVEEDTTWIKMHVGKPAVLKVDGKYRMYLEAPCTILDGKEFNNNVLMAESDDGIHFTYHGGEDPQPVIAMSEEQLAASIEHAKTGGTGYGHYGIGQPSAVYKDGITYLYCTYSLEQGDRFYCFRSEDGVHFDEGTQVFLRAGSGVKYNDLTGKFMMTYSRDQDGQSRVYYMESDDGIAFTYSDYAGASANPNVIARGSGLVRNYPDFVSDAHGHVKTETMYVAYMEGKMAGVGSDWRQFSHTWDIHIAMVNPPEYANRPMVLPNGKLAEAEALRDYAGKHSPLDPQTLSMKKSSLVPELDGKKDRAYGASHPIERVSYLHGAVPSALKGEIAFLATEEAFFLHVGAADLGKDDHRVEVFFQEETETEPLRIRAESGAFTALRGEEIDVSVAGQASQEGAAAFYEFRIPRLASSRLRLDVHLWRSQSSNHYKNIVAWSDPLLSEDPAKIGEILLES